MTDTGQDIAYAESKFENAKAARLIAKHRWDAAKGRLHMELVARREAGENLTVSDIKAIEAVSIDNVDYVKSAYLAFINADSDYRAAKISFDACTRNYWDCKPGRM